MEKYVAYSKNGTRVESGCDDWCGMYKIIEDYKEQNGMSEDDAYKQFWDDVKSYDESNFNEIISLYENFEDALGEGALDGIRIDYLDSIGMFNEIEEIEEIGG